MLDRIDRDDADIAAIDAQIETLLDPFADAIARLDEIPGIGPTAAAVIIAEIGVDMARFPTPGHLASWAKFAPGIKASAGKTKGNGATGKGNRYLARVLGEAAAGAARTDTFLGARYRRIARRREEESHRRHRTLDPGDHLDPDWPIPRRDSKTSAPTMTTATSLPPPRNAATSEASKHSATTSPCNPPPEPPPKPLPGSAGCCRARGWVHSRTRSRFRTEGCGPRTEGCGPRTEGCGLRAAGCGLRASAMSFD